MPLLTITVQVSYAWLTVSDFVSFLWPSVSVVRCDAGRVWTLTLPFFPPFMFSSLGMRVQTK